MAAENHFTFVKGEDIQINWTIYQDENQTSVQDISGWTFHYKVKRRDSDVSAALVTTVTSIVDAAGGSAQTTIAAAQMALLSGDYRASLWRTNAGGASCLSRDDFTVLDSTED